MLAEIVWNQNTLAVLMVFLMPITGIIATFWWMVEKTRAETDLKRTMVERGMSAEDIERVIAAKSPETHDSPKK